MMQRYANLPAAAREGAFGRARSAAEAANRRDIESGWLKEPEVDVEGAKGGFGWRLRNKNREALARLYGAQAAGLLPENLEETAAFTRAVLDAATPEFEDQLTPDQKFFLERTGQLPAVWEDALREKMIREANQRLANVRLDEQTFALPPEAKWDR
jgi:hypothetical protein